MRKILLPFITLLLVACTEQKPDGMDSTAQPSKHRVVTSNYPLYFFTSEIAGDSITVNFPEIEGDPAMWAPAGPDADLLQSADLLILNGAGYESWLAFTTLPQDRSLDTTAKVGTKLLPIENETVHQHGPGGAHSHQGVAFTTWLDPQLAIEQARAITIGLSSLAPEQSADYQSGFEQLSQRLLQSDQSLKQALTNLDDHPVIFSHPVYQYLQERYNINGQSVHWEPDLEPGTKQWIDFGNLLRKHPAKIMFWEDTPLDSVRQKLKKMGVESFVFNPAGNKPHEGDYFSVMEQNLLAVKQASAFVSEGSTPISDR
jgi:zinc transport system substrate-binding protein